MRFIAGIVGLVLSMPCSGAMLIIDSFHIDQPLVSASGPGGRRSAYAAQQALDAIGGHRELMVSRHAGGGVVSADVGITLDSAFNYASAALARGSVVVKWDGAVSSNPQSTASEAPSMFALRADLTSGGQNNGVMFSGYSDLGVDVTLTFYQSASRFVTAVVRVAPGFNPDEDPVLTDFYVPFSDFQTTGVLSPVDVFADTRAITMNVAGKSGADAAVRTVARMELPESPGLCAAGLLALVAFKRVHAS